MNSNSQLNLNGRQQSDFMTYLDDHHLISDSILTMTEGEMYEVLCVLSCNWRVSLAHTLAITHPDTELQFDVIESRLQGLMRPAGRAEKE